MALIEGVKYGLSSYQNSNTHPSSPTAPVSSNKSVLFVKLTDSAIRAIEEYLRTQQKTGQNATLQFLGNEGRINIPSSHSSQGQTFDFSLQSNADIEGPQGSFECIQQSSSRSLESMGALPFKMRIKANDDVYAETRQRFIQAEDIRKQECAKEIKPNGPDIGRKVKKKLDRIPPPACRREPSPFSHCKSSPSNSSTNVKSSNNPYGYSTSSSSSSNKHFSGFNPIGNNSSNNGNSRPSSGIKPGTGPSDIAKRPLKERLIHLLAIRPFKKPELQARLSRDGIKDREKQLVMTILKQISTFKNMEYVLLRGVWNDVQEDWPCYTEQERQLMKRRKPQNLTPPGSDSSVSSGVSGCSGLSPRSTASSGGNCSPSHQNGQYSNSHFGTKSGSGSRYSSSGQVHGSGGKRPLSSEPIVGPDGILLEDISTYVDGPNNKKARVSHFKRPVRSSGGTSLGANLGSRPDRDGLSPNLHQNRIAERLSPIGSINGSSGNMSHSNAGLAHSYTNHRSPSNLPDHASSSPFYNTGMNNDLSPPEQFNEGGDNMGGFSPYSWNSNGNDAPGNQAMDSDETDSIDSGNGSSTSTSGRRYHHTDEPAFNGVSAFQSGSLSNLKLLQRGLEHGGSQSAFVLNNSASCNRVSSTTQGSGSGYLPSPQSSPESHNEPLQLLPQHKEDECEVKHRPSAGQGYLTAGGGGYSDNASGAGQSSLPTKHSREGHGERERRGDNKERSNGRERVKDKESRPRDRERNDRRDREERKSAQKGTDHNMTRKATVNGNNFDNLITKSSENPAYLTQYTPIQSDEQRSRYKDDFNSDYPLYRDLHAVIEKVSKKFAQLEESLREEVRGSEEYQNIRDQIVREYYASKKDKKYQEAKEKFNYLHKKLAFIKEQVATYDRHSLGDEMVSPVR